MQKKTFSKEEKAVDIELTDEEMVKEGKREVKHKDNIKSCAFLSLIINIIITIFMKMNLKNYLESCTLNEKM